MRMTIALLATTMAASAAAQDPARCPKHGASVADHAAPAAHDRGAHGAAASPYAGHETRKIKALSAEQVQGYLEGRGAGLALPAELNHYPGPRHVLDLAEELALSPEQIARTQASFAAMDADARRLGAELVQAEEALDRLFASGAADDASLRKATAASGRIQAELRRVHLRAHLETRALLTADQVARYDVLRGYAEGAPTSHAH